MFSGACFSLAKTHLGLSPPISFRLRKSRRYSPDRKTLLIASEEEPCTFEQPKQFAFGTPRPDPTALAILSPCLAASRKHQVWRENVTSKCLIPQDLGAGKSSQSHSVKLPSNNKNWTAYSAFHICTETFPHRPCRDSEEFGERVYNTSFFPIKKKNIANVPKSQQSSHWFFKETFLVAHTSESVTGQLKKVIYDLAQTVVDA